MERVQVVQQPRATRRLCDGDWESYKRFIWTALFGSQSEKIELFGRNVGKVELNELVDMLRDGGFEVNKAQLEQQLAKWRFRTKLDPNVWRHIEKVIGDRWRSFHKKTAVILSGHRIASEEVQKQIKRHRQIKIHPDPVTAPSEDRIALYLCTPHGSSTDLVHMAQFAGNLPWIQFNTHHLGLLLSYIKFVPGKRATIRPAVEDYHTSNAPGELSVLARRDQATFKEADRRDYLPLILGCLIRRSLSLVGWNEELALELYARKSIDCIAARFDYVLPKVYEGENRQRAGILVNGSPSEIQQESLKILLYLASNHLIMDQGFYPSVRAAYLADARLVVGICRLAGIPMIRKLVELSYESPTLTAVIDVLFEAAVNTEAVDLMSFLLSEDGRISPDREIGVMDWQDVEVEEGGLPPLAVAVGHRSIAMITALLRAGADTHHIHIRGLSLLVLAILESYPPPSQCLVQTLLDGGVPVNETDNDTLSGLQAAFMIGDLGIVELLTRKGANFDYELSTYSGYHTRELRFYGLVDQVGALELAASFTSRGREYLMVHTLPTELLDASHDARFEVDQDKSLEMCRWICQHHRQRTSFPIEWTKGAMIMAAARGYTKVIAFLHQEFSAPLEPLKCSHGLVTPLHAASYWGQNSTCSLLLRLEKCSRPHGTQTSIIQKGPGPSPLHLAAARKHCDVVRSLLGQIEHSNINQLSAICLDPHEQNGMLWAYSAHVHHRHAQIEEAPFGLAMLCEAWNTALLLAQSGAAVTGSDLFVAATAGQTELVKQLLSQGIHPNEAISGDNTALQTAITAGHYPVGVLLLAAGADIDQVGPGSIWRLPDVTLIRQTMQCPWAQDPRSLGPDQDGRSYLENAILSKSEDVIRFAFSLNTAAYDSGALCAAVYLATHSALPNEGDVLQELIRRRTQTCGDHTADSALENTAIGLAAWRGRLNLVTQLLEDRQAAASTQLAKMPGPVESRYENYSPDHLLAPEVYEDIEYDSVNWHAPDNLDVSPMLFAVSGGNQEIIQVLIDAGYVADVLIIRAAIRQELAFDLFEKLLETFDGDIDIPGDYKIEYMRYTPLICAVEAGRADIVEILLDRGADPSTPAVQSQWGDERMTPLKMAIQKNQLAIVDLLLRRGAKVNDPVWCPWFPGATTALRMAAESGYIGLVRQLLDHGADVNHRRNLDDFNPAYTALEVAADRGRLDTVQLLLNANVNIENFGRYQYVRAVYVAEKNGHGAVAELLKSYGHLRLEDEEILDEIKDERRALFISPREFRSDELVEMVAHLPDWVLGKFGGTWRPQKWHRGVARQILKWADVVASRQPDCDGNNILKEAVRVAWQATGDWVPAVNLPSFMLDDSVDYDSFDYDSTDNDSTDDDSTDDEPGDKSDDESGNMTNDGLHGIAGGLSLDEWARLEQEQRRRIQERYAERRRRKRKRHIIAARAARVASEALEEWALRFTAHDNGLVESLQSPRSDLEPMDEATPACNAEAELWDEPTDSGVEETPSDDARMFDVEQDDLYYVDDPGCLRVERRERFRRDMAGEEEAQFVPMVWEP